MPSAIKILRGRRVSGIPSLRLSVSSLFYKLSPFWRFRHAATGALAALTLSACVESEIPLVANGKSLLGSNFEVHLYEDFVENKATNFHASTYSWRDGQYVRASNVAYEAARFVAEPLGESDFLVQLTDGRAKIATYWVARKVTGGVYRIFAINERDVDEKSRNASCESNQPEGICRIKSYEALIILAKATAARPIREAALGVIVSK